MTNALSSALDTGAPAPLAPLEHVIISPANVEAEKREYDAVTLTREEMKAARAEIKELRAFLRAERFQDVRNQRAKIKADIERLHERYLDLKEALEAAPDDESLQEQLNALWDELTPVRAEWNEVNTRYQELLPYAQRGKMLVRKVQDHDISIERDRTAGKLRAALLKEARIYERLIIDKWTRLGFCHRYYHKGEERVDRVQFDRVVSTMDAHFLKIDAAFQTAFKNWRTNIPDGVKVAEQLLNPSTLDELSITCQRQVTAVHGPRGAWVIVNRLSSSDGLMNYVNFDSVMDKYPARFNDRMPICVGVGINRAVQWLNLAEFPHWLIGGYTSSGKSNMVNVGICTLISRQSPTDLRLILIDLKGGLEFSFYEGIPHLHGEIVDHISKVADTLAQLEAMMEARFARFKSARVKVIDDFRAKRPGEYMPRVLCVFDEVASIIDHGETTKRIAASLRQLAAKGRAVGIHIWLCTQRPDVKIIEGAIKANLAVRISGRMTTSADSVTILGTSAAKELAAIPGRMVMQTGPTPVPVQTPHITEANIHKALSIARARAVPPPLDIPADTVVVHQEWTPERVIELSLKHLGGNITWKAVYQAADDLSQSQARELVERVWSMKEIEFEGRMYRVQKNRSNTRSLVEITPEGV